MQVLPREKRGRLIALGVGLVVVAGCLTFLFVDPATSPIFPPCPFYWLTGLYCPGCGSGRALHALLHGDVLVALDLNPLMVLSLPLLGYAAVSQLCVYLSGKSLPRIFVGRFWGWFVVCLVLVYWVVRNISIYPFTVLTP